MKSLRCSLIICFTFFCNSLFGQSDTTFWFAAPEVAFIGTPNTGLDRPILLHFTSGINPSIITISLPAYPAFVPITQTLAANSSVAVDLTTWIDQIETKPANQILNSGILIKSTNKITAYYEVTSGGCGFCNPEIFTLKGMNALGTNFFIPSQYIMNNSPDVGYSPTPKSAFDVVATEDNTVVSITPAKDIIGHIAGTLFTVMLNKGQTFSSTAVSQFATDHLMGSIVTATKKIAVTIKDDLMASSAYGTCADLGGDQIIPVTLLGTKYIPIKGYLNAPYDKVFVLAVTNNTQITIDGVVVTTLNAGSSYMHTLSNPVAYIESSAPAYVLHLSGFGCEVGLDVLPAIECTGSSSLSVKRSAADPLFLNLLVPAGGQGSFKYNGLAGIINAADFAVVPGTGGLYYYTSKNISLAITPAGANFLVTNSDKRFQMGVIHGQQANGCRFGYFSDYNTFKANISSNGPRFCSADTLRLHADSVSNSIIQWAGPNGFNSTAANPKLFVNNAINSGYYKVTINDPTCGIVTDSILVTVDITSVVTNNNTTICTGNSVQLNTSGAASYSWSPVTGLSNPAIANPVATPAVTTQYIVTGTKPSGCVGKDTVIITIAANSNFDFSYKQNVCNPLSVQFFNAGATPVNPYWSFGDGNTNSGSTNPTHIYAGYGNYTVKYHIDNATCPDTITKVISLQLNNADIVITPDTTICLGATKQLRSQPALSFCWSPTTYLNNPLLPNPVTSATAPITYYFTAEIVGANVITNGNFNAGNTGFTSGYNYAANNTTEGEYFVGPSPQAWNASLSNCTDHTSGNGNMLLVNGSPAPNVVVWSQAVSVIPNTNYAFSTWIQALYPPNPAQLSFSINGLSIGSLITASLPTCNWTQFYTTWNSGNNSSASISIVNKNTIVLGNDFALDDISFSPVSIKKDSVKINIDTPVVSTIADVIQCSGIPTQLTATGASVYSWSPATGLSNASIFNPVALPLISTRYTVTGTTVNGCVASDFVDITIQPKPAITKSRDTTICTGASVQLLATGGTNYTWSPAATLSNPNIANPIATPVASVTKYYVTVINSNINTCSNTDSVKITLKAAPVFTVSPAQSTCEGTPAQLNATGGDIYLWSPANSVNNATVANPLTNTGVSTNYSVTITESACNVSQTLFTTVTVNPEPLVSASKSNDIDCSIGFSNLMAGGASQYIWTPSTGLNNAGIANPVARPASTTRYIVTGTNSFGCLGYDSLTVVVTQLGKSLYLMPTSFTPNGDGLNDCFGLKYWGIIEELQFFIYNRYGEKVFSTTDPNKCWDGKYKTEKPEPGNYVYYIKAKTACGTVERKGNVILIR
ncbi:MAG: gliding motility-associated C-terminal domain-containing protein [Ferruginibacter sp.]